MIVHLNGKLIPAESAAVSVFDRGFLFGDGVYEGIRACEGHAVALEPHIERMRAGLAESGIEGFDPGAIGPMTQALLEANRLCDASVYWQVTRGAPASLADDTHLRARVPTAALGLTPTVFGYVAPLPPLSACREPAQRSATVLPDTRWLRGHLKSISLMGGVLAALEAHREGRDDAILVRDGMVTEGVATNVLVAKGGRVWTPPDRSGLLLSGVTKALLLAEDPGIEPRPVSERDLREADEVMLAGTFTMIASVTTIDGAPVGDGRVGPVARRLLRTLVETLRADAASRAR